MFSVTSSAAASLPPLRAVYCFTVSAVHVLVVQLAQHRIQIAVTVLRLVVVRIKTKVRSQAPI
jgi:hypothetical protein